MNPRERCTWCNHPPHTTNCPCRISTSPTTTTECPCTRHTKTAKP